MAKGAPGAAGSIRGAQAKALVGAGRLVVLLAPAIPLVTTVVLEIRRGWRPTSDDAAIAWRALDVFSVHAPLVGAYNDATVSAARPVFDLGPLQYYLLAIPERIDPLHGILWGSALIAVVLAALSVEAAARAGGILLGMVVSAGFLVLAATETPVVLNIAWNPNLGLYAFSAVIVLSAVAATGRTWWWPVAVAAGCLAAECHLVFAAPAALVLAVAIALGAFGARRVGSSARSSVVHGAIGLGLGLVCLLPTLIEEVTGRPGNLSALLDNIDRHGPGLGLATGLRSIARSALFPPLWARSAPSTHGPLWYHHFLAAVLTGSALAGLVVIGLAVVIGTIALLDGRQGLAATAFVAVGLATGLAWTIGKIAVGQVAVITYVAVALWPAGMVLDSVLVAGLVIGIAAVCSALGARPHLGTSAGDPSRQTAAMTAAMTLCLAGLLAWSLTDAVPAASKPAAIIGGWASARATGPLAASIKARHPGGPVIVEPTVPLLPDGLATWSLVEAVAYQLKLDGLEARLLTPMAAEFGPDARAPRRPTHGEAVFFISPTSPGRWRLDRGRLPVPISILGPR
ncbi:MAG: hypothetical protein ACYCSF_07240 [Acidimicrobiales bacterium]